MATLAEHDMERDMADREDPANTILPREPPVKFEHSGADVFTGLFFRTRVDLCVADYTLGAPDFATPALTQNHRLLAVTYLLGPLVFDAPAWRYRYQTVRWINAGSALGRHRHIPNSLLADLIPKLVDWLVEKQATRRFKRLTREDPVVKEYARELAAEAGIETSDGTLLQQIIRPAFQIIEAQEQLT